MGGDRNTFKVLAGISEIRIPLGRPNHRREDNIKTEL
jgi:hypothetical protein